MSADRNKKLQDALATAQKMLADAGTPDTEAVALVDRLVAEGRRLQQSSTATLLAFLADEPCPVLLLKPWASRRRFREWEIAGKLKLSQRNGKLCVVPSEFIAHWRRLKDKRKTKN